jgi:hypothetical protein
VDFSRRPLNHTHSAQLDSIHSPTTTHNKCIYTPRGKGSNRIGAGDNTMPPPLITGSPVVLSSLLMDSVTEDEFVDWATPQRAELAAFILRRRHKRRGASSDVGIVPTRRSLGGSMDAVAAAPSGRGRGRGVVPEGIPPAVPVAL